MIEGRDVALRHAERIREIAESQGFTYVFKSSFDKANRTSISSYRGPGLDDGLDILAEVKNEVGVRVLTDFHTAEQAKPVSKVVDILQVPAFLCRQTDLLVAAAETGKAVNVKKGQFLAPENMKPVVGKLEESGCNDILLTERGATFGYGNLVVDFRSIPIMRGLGYPVVFDGTHSVQRPGGLGDKSGGDRTQVPGLVRAAAAVGRRRVLHGSARRSGQREVRRSQHGPHRGPGHDPRADPGDPRSRSTSRRSPKALSRNPATRRRLRGRAAA